jgi:hypothetical protein
MPWDDGDDALSIRGRARAIPGTSYWPFLKIAVPVQYSTHRTLLPVGELKTTRVHSTVQYTVIGDVGRMTKGTHEWDIIDKACGMRACPQICSLLITKIRSSIRERRLTSTEHYR